MVIRIFLSLSILSLVAFLGLNYARKKSAYVYTYTLSDMSKTAMNEDLLKEITYYQNKLKKKSASSQDLTRLAQLYSRRAKTMNMPEYFEEARHLAYKSIGLMPQRNPNAFYVLADIALFNHDYKNAIDYAKVILNQKKSSSAEAYFILANSYFSVGNMVEANFFADELIANYPSERAYTLRAMIFSDQGRDDEAIADFEEAINQKEDDQEQAATTRAMYGKYFLDRSTIRGNLDRAYELLSESLRIYPTNSTALDLMGDYLEKDKNFNKAAMFYKKAFYESRQLKYLFKEASAHKKSGEKEFADKLFAQVEILLRDNLLQNKKADAAELIRFLLERGADKDYPEVMMLARAQVRKKESTESILLLAWSLEVNNKLNEANKFIRGLINKSVRSNEVLGRAKIIEEKLKTKPRFFQARLNTQTSL